MCEVFDLEGLPDDEFYHVLSFLNFWVGISFKWTFTHKQHAWGLPPSIWKTKIDLYSLQVKIQKPKSTFLAAFNAYQKVTLISIL